MKNKEPARYIKVDGTVSEIYPKDSKSFTLKELQDLIGGSKVIDIQPLPSGDFIIVDDNGKQGDHMVLGKDGRLVDAFKNEVATDIWKKEYPIEKYPFNNDELIVGNVVVSPREFIR